MYEDLESHPALVSENAASEKSLKFIRENLSDIAPDYVRFVEKFGRANINDCGFIVYGWTENLSDFFVDTLGLERPNVDAWLIGDNFSEDYAGIDKKTGKVVEVSIENCEAYDDGTETYNEFIRRFIGYYRER